MSANTLIRIIGTHFDCAPASCIQLYPRQYFPDGIFKPASCGFEDIRKIDTLLCGDNSASISEVLAGCNESCINLEIVRMGDLDEIPAQLLKMLPHSKIKTISATNLPRIIDMSNLNMKLIAAPLLRMFETYEKPSAVEVLNVSNNRLSGVRLLEILNSISRYDKISTLDVSSNLLEDLPSILLSQQSFPLLSKIIAGSNRISDINRAMAQWIFSDTLELNFGKENVVRTIAVADLDLWPHTFASFVEHIARSAGPINATSINIVKCGLRGSIEAIISPHIETMSIVKSTILGGIPNSISRAKQLTALMVAENDLKGTLPATLGQLTKLERLLVYANHLTGTLPRELSSLTLLEHARLEGNQLSGQIPREIGELTSLTKLVLHRNNFVGKIPTQIGKLTRLKVLLLQGNKLSGSIPKELGALSDLTTLGFRNNSLSNTTLPWEVATLPKLAWVYS